MKIIKFIISGMSAALMEYASFFILQSYLGEDELLVSQSLSFLAGFVVSFTLNKYWVFKSAGNAMKELFKYLVLFGINLILTNVAMHLLVSEAGVSAWIAKIVVMTFVATWNYLIFQRIIFKPTRLA